MNVVIDGANYKPVESKTSFDIWVDSMYDNYINEVDKYVCIIDGLRKTVKLCCGKKSATTKCSPEDKFSVRVGIAIAFARLNKLPIYNEVLTKENNEKEFNRHKFRNYLMNTCSSSVCKRCPIKKLKKLYNYSSCMTVVAIFDDSKWNSYSDEYLKSIYQGLKDLGYEIEL